MNGSNINWNTNTTGFSPLDTSLFQTNDVSSNQNLFGYSTTQPRNEFSSSPSALNLGPPPPIGCTSRDIFRRYFVRDANGNLDASHIFGRECYVEWLATRRRLPRQISRAFQCSIRNVVTGANGTKCFSSEEERAILKYLREKRNKGWPCFQNGRESTRMLGWTHVLGANEKLEADGCKGNTKSTIDYQDEKNWEQPDSPISHRLTNISMPAQVGPLCFGGALPSQTSNNIARDNNTVFTTIAPQPQNSQPSAHKQTMWLETLLELQKQTQLTQTAVSQNNVSGTNYLDIKHNILELFPGADSFK